jgi:hypothetical protein
VPAVHGTLMVRIGGPTAGEDNSHSISGANRRMNCVQQAGIMALGGDRLVGFLKELSAFRRYMRASRRATATVLPLGIGGSCLSADGERHAFFAYCKQRCHRVCLDPGSGQRASDGSQ